MNPYLKDGFDHYTLTRHCADCESPLFTPDQVITDHVLCTWSHYGYIAYPVIYATDENGKTIEDIIAMPARNIITRIPHHSGVSFCQGCFPEWKVEGCAVCGRRVDTLDPYSRAETIKKFLSGINTDYKVYLFHQECLSQDLFPEVHNYQIKYKPQPFN